MLRQLSGKEPDASVSADEAVAHGAALHAGLVLAEQAGVRPNFQLRNVSAHSLGVVGTDRLTGSKRNVVLVPRNTALPASAKRIFKTQMPGQKSVLVQIVEGESQTPDGCTSIGQCVVRGLPPTLPDGTPINVRFRYSTDGRLNVVVKVAGTSQQLICELKRDHGLGDDDRESWRRRICGR